MEVEVVRCVLAPCGFPGRRVKGIGDRVSGVGRGFVAKSPSTGTPGPAAPDENQETLATADSVPARPDVGGVQKRRFVDAGNRPVARSSIQSFPDRARESNGLALPTIQTLLPHGYCTHLNLVSHRHIHGADSSFSRRMRTLLGHTKFARNEIGFSWKRREEFPGRRRRPA